MQPWGEVQWEQGPLTESMARSGMEWGTMSYLNVNFDWHITFQAIYCMKNYWRPWQDYSLFMDQSAVSFSPPKFPLGAARNVLENPSVAS